MQEEILLLENKFCSYLTNPLELLDLIKQYQIGIAKELTNIFRMDRMLYIQLK